MYIVLMLRHSGASLVKKVCNKLTPLLLILLATTAQAGDVQLYAATSLTDALTELSSVYQKSNKGVLIKKAFAGSSTLAKQIENGAPADIFISADNDWGEYLHRRGLLVKESHKKLCSNELVLIAPVTSDFKIRLEPGFDLDKGFAGRLCTGDTLSVPVGKYAKQSLLFYDWWDNISSRIVGTEDVRTALAFVERAECGLGIVYKTDAKLSKKIKVVARFPADSHSPIEYSGALTKKAGTEAKAFWTFLQSDTAKAVFIRYGFNPLN